MISLLFLFASAFLIYTASATSFDDTAQCASFSDAGVNGYFAMYNPNNGQSYYNFNIDTSLFASQCSTASTLGYIYHIHTSWTNTTTMASTGGTYCGKPFTGVHYDPSVACSPNSQYTVNPCIPSSTTPCCTQMGRVSPGYNYTCSPSTYNTGNYSTCERGDLSGKFGAVFPNSNGFITSNGVLVDKLPYFNANYLYAEPTSTMWASMVVHCASSGARVLCGKFSPQQPYLQQCSSGFSAISKYLYSADDDDGDDTNTRVSDKKYNAAITITFFVVLVSGIVLGMGFNHFFGHLFYKINTDPNVV